MKSATRMIAFLWCLLLIAPGCRNISRNDDMANSNGLSNAASPASTTPSVPFDKTLRIENLPVFRNAEAASSEPIKSRFSNLPGAQTTASAGEYVFAPYYSDLSRTDEDIHYGIGKMVTADKEYSEVHFSDARKKISNAYIIPIAAGQKTQQGDIVLLRGLSRAIVLEASDPHSPIVQNLDCYYAGGGVDCTQRIKLSPDTFVILTDSFQPGTSVAVQTDPFPIYARVISVLDDKVLVIAEEKREDHFTVRKFRVFAKKDCKPLPIVPKVKEGDNVEFILNIGSAPVTAKVSRVDFRIGRVYVKFDAMIYRGVEKREAKGFEGEISFGDVLR